MAKVAPKEERGGVSDMIGRNHREWAYQLGFLRRHAPDQQTPKTTRKTSIVENCLQKNKAENQSLCYSLLARTICSLFAVSKPVSIHPRRTVSPPALDAPNGRRVSYPADRVQTFHISFLNLTCHNE